MTTNGGLGRQRPPELMIGGRRISTTNPLTITGSSVGLINGVSRHRRDHSSTTQNVAIPSSSSPSAVQIVSPASKKSKLHKTSSSIRKGKTQQASFAVRLERQIEYTSTLLNVTLERLLRRHGKYVSRHPVKTLLVACLIITSLFYPAAGIYLWASKGGPGVTRGDARSVWRSLSTPFLDSFASSGRKHHNSLRDLRMVWDDAPDLRAVDARDSDAYLRAITPLNIFPNSWPAVSNKDEHGESKGRNCTSVRVEHVFVTTDDVMLGMGHRYGALDIPILQSAMSLQNTIEAYLKRGQAKLQCLNALGTENCLTLSPLSYWQQDIKLLSADSSPTKTLLGTKMNMSDQGIPLRLTTTLAGRSHLFTKLPRADHLALTFFIQDEDSNGYSCLDQSKSSSTISTFSDDKFSDHHEAFLGMLRNITGGHVGILNSEITSTKEVILQFNPLQTSNTFFTQRMLLILSYVAAFIWLCRGLMRLQNVHSRFGLALTGVLELIISMTLAVSICALCGVRLTLVPWEILPFVIVVLGSENMFVLTNAIISTPISLTVPTRIATGLGKVGVPIAVTVMSDVLLMLAIMMFVDVRAVREFCIFAIFSLFVDFFMQMTFFTTVLSIDLQRLELADLLSQGGSKESHDITISRQSANNDTPMSEDFPVIQEESYPSRRRNISNRKPTSSSTSIGSSLIKMSCRAIWRARTARTASLSLLLAFMFGIYLYHGSGYPSLQSYPFQQLSNSTQSTITASLPISTLVEGNSPQFDPFSHLTHDSHDVPTFPTPWWHDSPSAQFWQALNPRDAISVRVKVEPWTIISLRSTKTYEKGRGSGMANFASWAIFRPRVRAFIWFFKLAVLPIAGTTGLLWVLLLYLLKDTELLEAQRDRSEGFSGNISEEEDHEDLMQPNRQEFFTEAEVNLCTSSGSHSSDVTLLTQSGGYIVSIAADSSLSIWKPSKRGKCSTILLSSVMTNFTRITALEADAELDMIALGHASGYVSLWTLSTLSPLTMNSNVKDSPSSQVQSVFFIPNVTDRFIVCSAHRNGSLIQWRQDSHKIVLAAQDDALWIAFTPWSSDGKCRNIIALTSSDRRFQIYRFSSDLMAPKCLFSIQNEDVLVQCATLSTISFGEEEHSRENTWNVAIAGTDRGKIIVYDFKTGSSLGRHDIFDGSITSIRAIDIMQACPLYNNDTNRDIIVVNSTTRSTILTLGSHSDHNTHTISPILRKNPYLTPHKTKVGLPSISSSSLHQEVSPPKEVSVKHQSNSSKDEMHSNDLSANGSIKHENGLLFEPLSIPSPHGTSSRRFSSQSTQIPTFDDDHSVQDREGPMPTSSSTIGSAPSSLLEHFDMDPFEASNGNVVDQSPLQWIRHASVECSRGGADLVRGADGARLVGVRRRARQVAIMDAKWEVFQIDLNSLFTSERRFTESLEGIQIRRIRLDLEDNLLFQQPQPQQSQVAAIANGGASLNDLASSFRSETLSLSKSLPILLSFTRLDHVQAFYKDKGGMEKSIKRREKRNVVFTFANCVACVTLYSNSS